MYAQILLNHNPIANSDPTIPAAQIASVTIDSTTCLRPTRAPHPPLVPRPGYLGHVTWSNPSIPPHPHQPISTPIACLNPHGIHPTKIGMVPCQFYLPILPCRPPSTRQFRRAKNDPHQPHHVHPYYTLSARSIFHFNLASISL